MNKEVLGAIVGITLLGLSKNVIGSRNDDEEESSSDDSGIIPFPFKGNPQDVPRAFNPPPKFWEMFPGPHMSEVPSAQELESAREQRREQVDELKMWIEDLRAKAQNSKAFIQSISEEDLASGKVVELPIVVLGDERYTLRELARLAKDRRHDRWFVKNFGRVLHRIMKSYNI